MVGTNCEACKGKHRPHTCKIVRRIARGRKRRSPLEAVENMLSFCASGPRMSRTSCELCLAKDRKIAACEEELKQLDEDDLLLSAEEEQSDDEEEQSDEESSDEVR